MFSSFWTREHEADGEYEYIDRLIGYRSDICRFQQTSQTSLDVNELVFFSIRLQRYEYLVPNYGIMQTTSGKVSQKELHELRREEDSFP